MSPLAKKLIGIGLVAGVAIALFSFSCSAPGNANTAYAETGAVVAIPSDALSVTEALQTSFRAISAGVLPSVVEIDVVETKTVQSSPFNGFPFFFFGTPDNQNSEPKEFRQEALGSGVIVRRTGNTYYVLTNDHVVGTANEISVKLNDGRVFPAKLVGNDNRKDVALVSFDSDDSKIPVAVLGDSDTVQAGDICFAMGTPLGFYSSVSQGIVSATGRSGGPGNIISDFIQTDAAINQGNSGGPLVNIYGEVIGINTWIATAGSSGSVGLGFSIPINNIKRSIDAFINNGKVTYGWLGVSLIEADADYQKAMNIEGKTGAFVSQIFLNSPAWKGGMLPGDYIIALNGKPVKTRDQLVMEVGDLVAGTTASFTVLRNGKQVELKVKIEERNESVISDNSKLWPGFMPYPLTDPMKKQLKIDDKVKGVVVTNIQAKSAAVIMGLQSGDVITKVNDTPVTNLMEFYNALNKSGNKEIWFEVSREGHTISTVKYKL